QLRPVSQCMICQSPFDETHIPVALNCKHIFGQSCLVEWLTNGSGNTGACPCCRQDLLRQNNNIWSALTENSDESLQAFLYYLCRFSRTVNGPQISSRDAYERVIRPALECTAESAGQASPFALSRNQLDAAYHQHRLNQAREPGGIAILFHRLTRLSFDAYRIAPLHLRASLPFNNLVWKANVCIGSASAEISWDHLNEASEMGNERYFDFLHLYTVLVSQHLAHEGAKTGWPERRHERMNLVVKSCCHGIGASWIGKPTNKFKDRLALVYEELRRLQLDLGKISLRGGDGEEHVVRGLWQSAAW
ncbi:hypothetical protein K491DRAFT_563201, partial [Lophiostoma macrostomum CBS 122681]